MTQQNARPRDDQSQEAGSNSVQVSQTVPIMARPGDGFRARRVRRWARRELVALLEPFEPWTFAEPVGDPYHDSHLDRGWTEREALGRDLATSGWCR